MKNILLFVLLISLGNLSLARADTSEQFIGTWFLQNIESRSENGEWVSDGLLGPNPFGIIMYDKSGNMTVQIARRDRSISDPENANANIVNGYVAYAGNYEVNINAGTVTHHRLAHINADLDNQSVIRHYHFDGDTLTLTVAPDKNLRLTWKRQE